MALFGGNKKQETVENEVMQKLAQVELLELLIKNVLREAEEGNPWITNCQSYYDNCRREVMIAPDLFSIRWVMVEKNEYIGNDGKLHTNQEEKEMGHLGYSYTKSGYRPLHHHCNEKGKEDITLIRVCELWAGVVKESMQARMPQCIFTQGVNVMNDIVTFSYKVPSPTWKGWF